VFSSWLKRSLLCCAFLAFDALSADKVITIAGDNWCPINCSTIDKDKGYMIDVAELIFKQHGYQLKYIEMPWTRAVELARAGEIDGIVGAFEGDAPDFVFPEEALLNISPNNLFTLAASSYQYQALPSLQNLTLGTIKGYDYGESLNEYISKNKDVNTNAINEIYGNDAVKRNIELLLRERIDVFAESSAVFWYQVTTMGIADKFKMVGRVSAEQPCYIAFTPELSTSSELAKTLTNGLRSKALAPQIKELATKYGLNN
jgi:polar amino acid transport system substrate-binding protein